jgi:hypothetical protein
MKPFVIRRASLWLACILATAACRPARARDAADILRRAELAVRPADAGKPRTIVLEGTYEYRGQGGQHGIAPLYIHWREPGILYQELTAPFGLMRRWYDGTRGWASRPEFPNRPLPDAELSEAKRDAAWYQPWAMAGEYSSMTYEGRRSDAGQQYDVVAAQSRLGKTERFWFDAGTGRVKYLDVWEEGPEGLRVPGGGEFYQTRYIVEDYRAVGRIAMPFHVRRIRPNSSIDMRFTSVRIDVPVDTLRERAPSDTIGRDR